MQFAICNYTHTFLKSKLVFLLQLIHLIILCKVLKYNYQKKNSLRGILYFISKNTR